MQRFARLTLCSFALASLLACNAETAPNAVEGIENSSQLEEQNKNEATENSETSSKDSESNSPSDTDTIIPAENAALNDNMPDAPATEAPANNIIDNTETIPTPGESAPMEIIAVDFRAQVINSQRELLPIVQTDFVANPYNLAELQASAARRNQVEARPLPPEPTDNKYTIEEKVCTSSGCTTQQSYNNRAYQDDLDEYNNLILPDWEARAYLGLEADIEKASNGRQSIRFTTNERGEANLTMGTGTWYFSGRYDSVNFNVIWDAASFEIKTSTRLVNLTG